MAPPPGAPSAANGGGGGELELGVNAGVWNRGTGLVQDHKDRGARMTVLYVQRRGIYSDFHVQTDRSQSDRW